MHRYYKIKTDSATGEKINALLKRVELFNAEVEVLREKYGFGSTWCSDFYFKNIAAVQFDTPPDPEIWKKVRDAFRGYYPKCNKAARSVMADFEKLSAFEIKMSDLNHTINNHTVLYRAGFLFNKEGHHIVTIDDQWGVKLPADCIEISNLEFAKYDK